MIAAIDTPERVRFLHRLAGPGQRACALLFDYLIQGMALAGVATLLLAFGMLRPKLGGVAVGVFLVALFVVSWLYGALFEYFWVGQTPGKRVMRLRVVREDGGAPSFRAAVLRNLARGVDALPMLYAVGVLSAMLDGRLRRLGDWLGGTMVVVEERAALAGGIVISPPISDEERLALPAMVSLPRRMRAAIEGLLRRQSRLAPARVEELAGLLAPEVTRRTGVEGATALRTLALAWARAERML